MCYLQILGKRVNLQCLSKLTVPLMLFIKENICTYMFICIHIYRSSHVNLLHTTVLPQSSEHISEVRKDHYPYLEN